jgi:hypothetical protein
MNKFIISESEKQRILNMHKSSSSRNYLNEDLMAPEPVINSQRAVSKFEQYSLPVGKAGPLDPQRVQRFLDSAVLTIQASNKTLLKFNQKGTLPKNFIKIMIGTDSQGPEHDNVKVARERAEVAIRMVYKAFAQSGLGWNETQIEKMITIGGAEYVPSTRDINNLEKTDTPLERFIKITITPLTTAGLEEDYITDIFDNISAAMDTSGGLGLNTDEEAIRIQICRLQTYSDIQDLDKRFKRRTGGLQSAMNKSITDAYGKLGSDTAERRLIAACLNKASKRSGKGDCAKIAGDKITIDLDKE